MRAVLPHTAHRRRSPPAFGVPRQGRFGLYPTGSGKRLTLDLIAADLQDRLISLFTTDANGRRPCFGGTERMQTDPAWHDNLIFGEYFHGDNGAALGAFHQTGWTGLIGDVIMRRHGAAPSIAEVLSDLSRKAGQ